MQVCLFQDTADTIWNPKNPNILISDVPSEEAGLQLSIKKDAD